MAIKWEDRYEYFNYLSEKELFEVARNSSVSVENRKLVVEIAFKKGYKFVNHPELSAFKAEFADKIAFEEIEDEPEVSDFGAPSASVTTLTLNSIQKMDEPDHFTPADEALDSKNTIHQEKE